MGAVQLLLSPEDLSRGRAAKSISSRMLMFMLMSLSAQPISRESGVQVALGRVGFSLQNGGVFP